MIVLHNLTHSDRTVSFVAVPYNRALTLIVGYLQLYPEDEIHLHDRYRPQDALVLEPIDTIQRRVEQVEAFYNPILFPNKDLPDERMHTPR